MKHLGFYTLAVLMIFLSSATCNKTDKGNSGNNNHNGGTGNSKPYTTGKNRFVLSVDGDSREYYVHVPLHYNGASAFPVVFMLHGSGGNGEKFYNISGWKEVGDQQNILTVFPSSWQYNCVYDDGVQKPNAEKWSSYDLELCNTSESPKNDIRFFSVVIDEMVQKYNVDANRIYIVGFSNGGEMASRAAIELSGKFAAAVACAGALPADTTLVPVRKLPVLLQAGNSDIKLMNKLGTNDPLPMNINQLFTEFPAIKNVVNLFVNAYELNTTYSTGGNPKRYVYADYIGISGQPENVFRFVLVEGLGHSYPNGNNHPLKAAEVHWDWMKNYHL